MADTGNTATIVFSSSSFVASYTMIGGTEQTREALEDTDLSVTGEKTYLAADLIEPGEFSCEYFFNQSASVYPPISAVAETVTVTFQKKTGESTAATFAGTGFITKSKGPDLKNGELMAGELTVQWDGKTGPTYTAGS